MCSQYFTFKCFFLKKRERQKQIHPQFVLKVFHPQSCGFASCFAFKKLYKSNKCKVADDFPISILSEAKSPDDHMSKDIYIKKSFISILIIFDRGDKFNSQFSPKAAFFTLNRTEP